MKYRIVHNGTFWKVQQKWGWLWWADISGRLTSHEKAKLWLESHLKDIAKYHATYSEVTRD